MAEFGQPRVTFPPECYRARPAQPRPSVRTPVVSVRRSSDRKESSMRAEAEPFAADGVPVGAVLCHGLTGMPGSMRPWAEALAAAGMTVRLPRLPGHGTRWQDANKVHWQDWYDELERAFDDVRSRCEQTFVLGLSMGGTLALRLAQQRGDDVTGVVV